MNNILIFGGTTEGRLLAEFCNEKNISAAVCVATEYGGSLLSNSSTVRVIVGRKDKAEIEQLIVTGNFTSVFDATHPYAMEVSKNVKAVCEGLNVTYYRVVREAEEDINGGLYFDTADEIALYLKDTEGHIFISTGSKELGAFGKYSIPERSVVRILPDEKTEHRCREMGFYQVITGKGPFSEEENIGHFGDCAYLVTKDSGAAGGFREKLSAAEKTGAKVLILRRPKENGISIEEAEMIILKGRPFMKKHIAIIGMGMEGRNTLTAEAAAAIEKAQLLIGARRMTEMLDISGKSVIIEYSSEKIVRYIEETELESIAVLMSGDCGFFSGAEKLSQMLSGHDVRIIAGISSPVYFCARLKKKWSDIAFVSMHGQDANIARKVSAHEKVFVILGKSDDAADICSRLTEYGLSQADVYIGERLGYEDEKITEGKAAELRSVQTDSLAVMLIENPRCERRRLIGIPDSEFIRGEVPMTKSEIRAAVISKLKINDNAVCWDIGSGTGSVSVEMAVWAESGKVYAVEKNSEAAALTISNARKFGCDNIISVEGNAPDVLTELPAPDCVFIGGSSGKISEICEICLEKNPRANIIITAVSLETLHEAQRVLQSCEVTELLVTRTVKRGSHTMLRAENPVFIIGRTLP